MRNELSIRRFGFALGTTMALMYVGCVFVMATVPKEASIRFFNSLLHGVDVESIMRWEMPWTEMVVGVLETFILGWLFGAAFAVFYNLGSAAPTAGETKPPAEPPHAS
tara:strand:- start:3071 stop:3394 length:324 start_codon:yes stop_codon:yes gene_type:complete